MAALLHSPAGLHMPEPSKIFPVFRAVQRRVGVERERKTNFKTILGSFVFFFSPPRSSTLVFI